MKKREGKTRCSAISWGLISWGTHLEGGRLRLNSLAWIKQNIQVSFLWLAAVSAVLPFLHWPKVGVTIWDGSPGAGGCKGGSELLLMLMSLQFLLVNGWGILHKEVPNCIHLAHFCKYLFITRNNGITNITCVFMLFHVHVSKCCK